MSKKNLIVKATALMAALTLSTSCFVGGTFAKYVSSDTGSDTARVAKWGVTVSATADDAFQEKYSMDDVNNYFSYSVESSTADMVVAPGTRGTFAGIEIKGTPEVAVQVTKDAELTLANWEIDGGFYCPIIINVGGTDISGLNYTSAENFANEVEAAIENQNGQYEANKKLEDISGMNGAYTWRWSFVDEGSGKQTDEKDTKLGVQAAKGTAGTITLSLTATVTQID